MILHTELIKKLYAQEIMISTVSVKFIRVLTDSIILTSGLIVYRPSVKIHFQWSFNSYIIYSCLFLVGYCHDLGI
jgi:hypothetical protein